MSPQIISSNPLGFQALPPHRSHPLSQMPRVIQFSILRTNLGQLSPPSFTHAWENSVPHFSHITGTIESATFHMIPGKFQSSIPHT